MSAVRTHYIDTSAIVKLFLKEDGSQAVTNYYHSQTNFHTTSLCFGETLGVLKARIRNREAYLRSCWSFMADVSAQKIFVEDVALSEWITYAEVANLAESYKLDILDAVQLYALRKGRLSIFAGGSRPILVTADDSLAKAARKEGFRVWHCLRENAP